MVYHTDYDIDSFTVYSSFFTGIPMEAHSSWFHRTANNIRKFPQRLTLSVIRTAIGSHTRMSDFMTPAHTRFLKIVLVGSAKAWSPQISKVVA